MYRTALLFLSLSSLGNAALAANEDLAKPLAGRDLVFEEKEGVVAFEAEHYFEQSLTKARQWYLTTNAKAPSVKPDGDDPHIAGASGGAYLECLPDTRRTHGDKLIKGQNFSNEPGKMAILSYRVHINNPGRYRIWGRAFSTTSEDNGFHIGLDGEWPASGQRWQTVVKRRWHWESKQRTAKVHVGVPGKLWLDIDKAGPHTILVAMREDGIELDKFLFAKDFKYTPKGLGPKPIVKAGTAPKPFPFVKPEKTAEAPQNNKPKPEEKKNAAGKKAGKHIVFMAAPSFPRDSKGAYVDNDRFAAIKPDVGKEAKTSSAFPFPDGVYDLTLHSAGENDGHSSFEVAINDTKLGSFKTPLSERIVEEGSKYEMTWKGVKIGTGDVISVSSAIGSRNGSDFTRARWSGISFAAADAKTKALVGKLSPKQRGVAKLAQAPTQKPVSKPKPRTRKPALHGDRKPDGDGSIEITGELKQWHKVTVTLDGPFAHENDKAPNPFTDYSLYVHFKHETGDPVYSVPAYFAADGNAGETSSESGTKWRAHLSPDKPGKWMYRTSMMTGPNVAIGIPVKAKILQKFSEKKGEFTIAKSDKEGRDFRAHGRLQYVGRHHLRFAGTGEFFLKAGADAPETLLGYADFDGTEARKPGKVPLKTWKPHIRDWESGDPTWKDGKGKGLIGALNYLAGKGCNVFSFLPYNAGGDGDNVWPFAAYGEKFHYDCSKLDQWGIVFDHATAKGLYLHFKLQETENDDNNRGHKESSVGYVPAALDGGDLGPERKLYLRELIARYGHLLALNWNLGEENTQSTAQQNAMIDYIRNIDPYDHNVVVHTFPNQQDKVYNALLGDKSQLTGLSLQNSHLKDCHSQIVKWTKASAEAGKPWVVAFDEPGSASHGMPADPDYPGSPKLDYPTVDQTRKWVLWGTLLGGGAGVEYYFGYKLPQNDLVCEDWRSRDLSWDYCRIALEFFRDEKIPFGEMKNADKLVGNEKHDNSRYCFARTGQIYLVYLPDGGSCELDLAGANGGFSVQWFNPRTGGELQAGSVKSVNGGGVISIGNPPDGEKDDWLAVVRKKQQR